ncbi:MAG TPA: flagellar hook-basal body complex protein FliE [Mycobacteriales bacterium]|nr:flagellar hook-basal body complex protein FliE [Mycobacteriales bacterium]
MTIAAVGPITIPVVPPITRPSTAENDMTQGNFAAQVGQGLNTLQQAQTKADDLAVQAATGDLLDVHDYMIAATEASLTTQLTVAVRNKAVDAFNEIMRMQA